MDTLDPLADPAEEDSPLAFVADRLEAEGLSRPDAEWLAELLWDELVRSRPPDPESEAPLEVFCRRFAAETAIPGSRHARLLSAVFTLAAIVEGRSSASQPSLDERPVERLLARALRVQPRIEFEAGLSELIDVESFSDSFSRACAFLRDEEVLDDAAIDRLERPITTHLRSALRAFDGCRRWANAESEEAQLPLPAVASLSFLRNVESRRKWSRSLPDPAPEVVLQWHVRIEDGLSHSPEDPGWLGALWILILHADLPELVHTSRARFLELAQRRLAYLRKDSETTSEPCGPRWNEGAEHDRDAISVVAKLGGQWKAVKSVLLLLRSLREPAVSADLRYWLEPRDLDGRHPDSPPITRTWIPESIATLFHEHASTASASDPELLSIRIEFARFCLDRLRSRDKTSEAEIQHGWEMVEPYPEWRRGYLRAVRELRVNPGGRGHRVLNWLSRNDPDESVRGEAGTAYAEMTADTRLAPGVSPRRALLAAFWHLRAAHYQTVRPNLDHAGAARTRQKESRRVKEQERQDPS